MAFVKNEMEIHNKLRHKNIVALKNYGMDGRIDRGDLLPEVTGFPYIMMEYASGGTLFDFMSGSK